MTIPATPTVLPTRILYTMIRVGDLERSIQFYHDAFGMHEVRRETSTEGRFTLVFIGYGHETENAMIELTYNWDQTHYKHGTGYRHIALEVNDIYAVCARLGKMGVDIIRAPGSMMVASDETGEREKIAFIKDPDGYKIELIEARRPAPRTAAPNTY